MSSAVEEVRIDKWLWAARVFKTRALALEACRGGHVKIGDQPVKPARNVHVGEIVVVRTLQGPVRTLSVVSVTDRRVGPKLVSTLYTDLTPPEELARVHRSPAARILARPRGTGRPTKRERRQLDRWLG